MNATSLYVSASRLLFQSDTEHANYTDLYRLVPYLRQSLSCTVCANLLVEPYSPQDMCQHHVCRGCIGGRKNLKPTCVSCKNYQCYQPNSQMRILLQCYKNLCKYILATPAVYDSMHRYVHVEASSNSGTDAHNLAELIDEGAQFHDDYKSNAGLKKAAFSILPFIFSSTAAAASAHNSAATVTSPPAPTITTTTNAARIAIAAVPSTSIATSIAAGDKATFLRSVSHAPIISTANRVLVSTAPPDRGDTITVMANANMLKGQAIKTVSNGSAMYSVLYSGAGNKITIKRKPDDVKTMAAPSSVALASGIGLTPTITTATLSATNMINLLNMNPPKIQQLPVQPQIALQQLQPIVPQQFQISQQVPTMMSAQHQNFKKPIILTPTLQNTKLVQAKRKGCRCGNATPTPGKLTCCGQRCPCYVESKSCVDCKCRGCRNPHRIDGQKVRPQIPLTCLVQMNNAPGMEKSYIQTYTPIVPEPTIKQEIVTPMTNLMPINSCQILPGTLNQTINLQPANESIEYMPNELDDGNIQVLNVYTTHMPEMTNSLPTIIMQDDPNIMTSTTSTGNFTLQKQLSLQPTYSLISEDLIKQSYSDDDCSSDDQSDVEIDL